MRRLALPVLVALFLSSPPALSQDAAPEGARVVETDSGLKIEILEPGQEGTQPAEGDRVKVHYTGTLTDGTKFDSSVDRGEPIEFVLGKGQVIPGWDEGIALLGVGAKAKLTIPPDLAYGKNPPPGSPIPPDATLVFTIELVDVTSELPFVKPDPEQQEALESGLKLQVLEEGEGEPAGKGEGVTLCFALFDEGGRLVDSTVKSGRKLGGALPLLSLKFLEQAVPRLRPGGSYLFTVPPELAFGEQPLGNRQVGELLPGSSVTIWRIELESVNDVPAFRMPAEGATKTTATGLVYELIEEGEGKSPLPTDRVKVHYTGWLTDGTIFDSSHGRGEPVVFPLNRVIPGWTEGVGLMKPGAKYLFSIPGKLAYGPRPPPGPIGPNATLVFLVELLAIQ